MQITTVKLCMNKIAFNPRPTTREYVHLVTRSNFRSRDKDGNHTIGSIIVENLMLYANFMTPCCTKPELLPIEVLPCGNMRLFAPVTLTLTR